MLTLDFSDTTAVVTGGTAGIGLATAELLLRAGAAVAICGRDAARLDAAERELRAHHPQARLLAQRCDVLDAAEVAALADAVGQRFGGVDLLVNNAGQGRQSTFADTTDEAWDEELRLKFFSLIRPTRAFLPALQRSPRAAVVCVNSLLALQPEGAMVATSAARAGAQSLVRSMATEFAPMGIRVNAILLGSVDSGQWRRRFAARPAAEQALDWDAWSRQQAERRRIELGRLGRPEEAAWAIVYLGTPLSSYTTGSSVDVSGGLARHL